jgi:hypothetical protein
MGLESKNATESSTKAVNEELRAGVWYVYHQYEIQDGPSGRYVQAPPAFLDDKGQPDPWRWEYEPLIKHEDLFLEFARLPEDAGLDSGDDLDSEQNADIARDWAETYGVLGMTLDKPPGKHSWWANPAGGEGDTVAGFAAEAWVAHRALRLYEAAKRSEPGGVDVDTIISLTPDRVHRDSLERFPEEAKGFALRDVVHEIQDRQPYYYEARYWPVTRSLRPTGEFVKGWGFTNLLGAIWLQAQWLLDADPGTVKRCAYPKCNRIIVYEQPEKSSLQKKGERKPYKTRRDIQYCPDDTRRYCRQKHWIEKKRRAAR